MGGAGNRAKEAGPGSLMSQGQKVSGAEHLEKRGIARGEAVG